MFHCLEEVISGTIFFHSFKTIAMGTKIFDVIWNRSVKCRRENVQGKIHQEMMLRHHQFICWYWFGELNRKGVLITLKLDFFKGLSEQMHLNNGFIVGDYKNWYVSVDGRKVPIWSHHCVIEDSFFFKLNGGAGLRYEGWVRINGGHIVQINGPFRPE